MMEKYLLSVQFEGTVVAKPQRQPAKRMTPSLPQNRGIAEYVFV
jgi:hypothetical protein